MMQSPRFIVKAHQNGEMSTHDYLSKLCNCLTLPQEQLELDVMSGNSDGFAWFLSNMMKAPEWKSIQDVSGYLQTLQNCADDKTAAVEKALPQLIRGRPFPDAIQPLACLAAQLGNSTILKACMNAGAQFDRFLDVSALQGLKNVAMLDFLTGMDWQDLRSNPELFQEKIYMCLDQPADVQAALYARGYTCPFDSFVWAVQRGVSRDKLKVMLYEGKARDGLKGSGALQFAARLGRTDVVELLLDAGANIDEIEVCEGERMADRPEQALHEAVRKRQADVVDLLLTRGSRPDVPGRYGDTALGCAEKMGDTETVAKLQAALAKAEESKAAQ